MTQGTTSTRRRPYRQQQQQQLSVRNNMEKRSREDLFAQRTNQHKQSFTSNSTASEAQSIQKSLMRTQSLLKNELHRVSNISNAIEEDEDVLRQTMDHHKSLNTKQAKKALTALQRAQQQEQRVLYAAIVFFCSVAFYVVWSRVLSKFDVISLILGWFV
jgi:uncharacterized membrane protein YjjP (DUF1212 family)